MDLLSLMFADDTCCLDSDDNLNNLISKVNHEINKIAVWFKANKMATNTSKTKYIIFRSKNKKINTNNLNVCILRMMLMTPMIPITRT
jgi:hypothetical protein